MLSERTRNDSAATGGRGMRRHYHSLALSQAGEKYGNRRESPDRSVTAAGKSQQGGSWGINATTPVSPTLLSLEGISHRQNQRGNQKARKLLFQIIKICCGAQSRVERGRVDPERQSENIQRSSDKCYGEK